MPFFDVQKRLALNLAHWMTIQKWIECTHGIGGICAEKRCKIEFDDFDKLIKAGKYTPPPHHLGKGDPALSRAAADVWRLMFFMFSLPLESSFTENPFVKMSKNKGLIYPIYFFKSCDIMAILSNKNTIGETEWV
ncbi:unnamed protein product [Nyctereutes procyonoides]|uniref:(raccoon dog) hypothetical protein n=1 Tax=Nyctereutes procyonoides TaxID=34880 RepID=A0A811YX44_NYCPR|nr:unnamed protein product [Nyctereutes procyonoides]